MSLSRKELDDYAVQEGADMIWRILSTYGMTTQHRIVQELFQRSIDAALRNAHEGSKGTSDKKKTRARKSVSGSEAEARGEAGVSVEHLPKKVV
jgi:hypothetical protein